MKSLASKIKRLWFAWRNHKYIDHMCSAAGLTLADLESHCVYYRMTLHEMVTYHKFFGRLPNPDYTRVIRHIGVKNLIAEVKKTVK